MHDSSTDAMSLDDELFRALRERDYDRVLDIARRAGPEPVTLTLAGFLAYRAQHGDSLATSAYTALLIRHHPFSAADIARGWLRDEQVAVEKKYAGTAPKVPVYEPAVPQPALCFPDIDFENQIIGVFFDEDSDAQTIDVTVVWQNEIMPLWLGQTEQALYATARLAHWGRLADVEHIELQYSDSFGTLESVKFYNYSFERSWNDLSFSETSKTIPGSEICRTQHGNPLIYVNTWNHEMGEANTSGQPGTNQLTAYPMYAAGVGTAKKWARDVYAPYANDSDVTWGPNVRVTNWNGHGWATTDGSPSAAGSGGRAMIVWQDSGSLYWTLYNGQGSPQAVKITGFTPSSSPAVVAAGNTFYLFCAPEQGGIAVMEFSTASGTWGQPVLITSAIAKRNIALCADVDDSNVHIAYLTTVNGKNVLQYGVLATHSLQWAGATGPSTIKHGTSSWGPALALLGEINRLTLFYRGEDHETVYWRYNDGGWVAERAINNYQSVRSPAVTVMNGATHMVCLGNVASGDAPEAGGSEAYELFYAYANDDVWIPVQLPIAETSTHSPALTTLGDGLLLVFCGGKSGYVDLKTATFVDE